MSGTIAPGHGKAISYTSGALISCWLGLNSAAPIIFKPYFCKQMAGNKTAAPAHRTGQQDHKQDHKQDSRPEPLAAQLSVLPR